MGDGAEEAQRGSRRAACTPSKESEEGKPRQEAKEGFWFGQRQIFKS
jgi:hypothetical protein